MARTDIYNAKHDLACGAHFTNMTTQPIMDSLAAGTGIPAEFQTAIQACVNDTSNYCYIDMAADNSSLSCVTSKHAGLVLTGALCNGTAQSVFTQCNILSMDQCGNGNNCTWNLTTTASGAVFNNETYMLGQNLTGGNFLTRSYCIPAPNVTFNGVVTDWAYFDSYAPGAQGDCSYAQQAALRMAYVETCMAVNTDPATGLMQGYANATGFNFTGVNATLMDACYSANCDIAEVPASSDLAYPVDWFTCQPDFYKYTTMAYYSHLDVALLHANRMCSDHSVRWNETACMAVKLPNY
jgi:hypothetical protein